MLVEESESEIRAKLRMNQENDEEIKKLSTQVKTNQVSGFRIIDSLLYKDERAEKLMVVPSLMQASLIRSVHECGHFSSDKTLQLLKNEYWFKKMQAKVEKVVKNCVPCIIAERKSGKKKGLLHSVEKDAPLDTYHIDHLGPMPSTKKNYQHIFVVIDAFTKFSWLYPTKSTRAAEVIDRLEKQALIFGNPRCIVSDRGPAFRSQDFTDYCKDEKITHGLIATGVPRGNGQVERVNRILIPLLTKLTAPLPADWHKYVGKAQQYLNYVPSRSTGFSPAQLLFGTKIRLKEDIRINEILEEESRKAFQERRNYVQEEARETISKIQRENERSFNKKRKMPQTYQENDLVAIQRTQGGAGKFHTKFLGPYKVVKALRNDRYLVEKIGEGEGPRKTSTVAEYMKQWANFREEWEDDDSEEENI